MSAPGILPPSRVELALDRCASPTVGPRRWGAYFVCGFTGYLVGLALATWLGFRFDLDLSARLGLALAPPVSFLIAVKVTQLLFGHERIVFYEQAIVTIGASALVALVGGDDVAVAIDLSTLAIGSFLGFGRIGCFRVACCHGRRARHGVAYGPAHAAAGFPARWVGHRLFPLQLVDGALSAALVVAGVIAIVHGAEPGVAACIYAGGYAVGRFALELWRGDPIRPYALGLSEAQWTAVVTSAAAAAWRPALGSIACAAVVATAAAVLAIARARGGLAHLWRTSAAHVHEVAGYADRFAAGAPGPVTTHEGLRLSAMRLPDGRLDLIVSDPARPLPARTVAAIAGQLGQPWTGHQLVAGRTPGLHHLILSSAAAHPGPK